MTDWGLMAMIATGCVLLTSAWWILFNTYRIQDLMIQCEEEKDIIRQERNVAEHMVKQADAQMRVLGATPVSRLIGGDDE